MVEVLRNFKPEDIPSKITTIGSKAGVAQAKWLEEQTNYIMNMTEIVGKFRQTRHTIAALVKPRPRVLIQLLCESGASLPMPLYKTYQELVDGSYDYDEYTLNAKYSDQDLKLEKSHLLILCICGLLNVEDGVVSLVTFHTDEVALVQAGNCMQKFDPSVDLAQLVAKAPKSDRQQLQAYKGNYSDFEQQRAERLANQQASYEKQQRRIAEIDDFVRRFRAKATKARQAQSRLKELERMEKLAPAHIEDQDKEFLLLNLNLYHVVDPVLHQNFLLLVQ